MPAEDKDAARPEREQALDKDSLAAVEEMHIPDYVMPDFGFPEGTRTSGKPPARERGLSSKLAADRAGDLL